MPGKGGSAMKVKIVQVGKGQEGVVLPDEYLRFLELIPGAEVEIVLDKEKKWIVVRPLHGDDYLEHFKESIDYMA